LTTLAICSALIGSLLGIRFRFVVLPPVIFIGSLFLGAISTTHGGTFAQTAVTIVVFAVLLQVGYVGAALFWHVVVPAHANEQAASMESPELR
jgi:hypothetical protein